MLNKQKGNMYPFVTHTWNAVKGKCPHDCSYCYMKVYKQPELHFDEAELKTDLGTGNFIFVGSSCDMWAKEIPDEWINKVLIKCHNSKNKYLFQTKNPARFANFLFPEDAIIGCTIESNRCWNGSKAPCPIFRLDEMQFAIEVNKMISIEPIMDFDFDVLAEWIRDINPQFVSIGADSKGHNLPEPTPDKVEALISNLQSFTKVIIKDNLKRLRASHFGIERKEWPC